MAKNIVAYIGVNSFDIILYLSRILVALDHRVLLVDNSDTRELACSFPQIKGVDSDCNCITYQSVDFTTQAVTMELSDQYDDILIDFGFHQANMDISLLTRVIYVVDMFDSNIRRITAVDNFRGVADRTLLIRDIIDSGISIDQIIVSVNVNIPRCNISLLPRDDGDYYNSFLCQLTKAPHFTYISRRMKEYLFREIKNLYSELSDRQLKFVYHKARRGE